MHTKGANCVVVLPVELSRLLEDSFDGDWIKKENECLALQIVNKNLERNMNNALNVKNVRFTTPASGIEILQGGNSDRGFVASLSPKPQRQCGLREHTEHCNVYSQSLVSRPSERFPKVAFCRKVGPRLSVRYSGTSMQ